MVFKKRLLQLLMAGVLLLGLAACGPSSSEVDSDTITDFCNLSLVVCDQRRKDCIAANSPTDNAQQCEAKFISCLYAVCQSVNLKN